MIVKCSVFACLMACVVGWGRGDLERFGPLRMILNSPLIKCVQNRSLNLDVRNTTVFFYDFENNYNDSFPIHEAADGILNIKHLDKSKQFVMFVGGFTSAIFKEIEEQMREAYKTLPNSYFIIPDHSNYTYSSGSSIRSYERSVSHVHFIGKAIGEMLSKLHVAGVSAEDMHCVGHSLGAQMLGHAGTAFFNATGVKIARITALDPAGPCFTTSKVEDQVRAGVAHYVDVYHCNAGALGSSSILGDVNFVINKRGEVQPSCNTPLIPELFDSSRAASCSHRYCIDVWTATVKNSHLFRAFKCDSYDNVKSKECTVDEVVAGHAHPRTARGLYYFSTELHNMTKLR